MIRFATPAALAALLLAPVASAKVAPEDAAAIGRTLTAFGAQQAANDDASIPAWNGGLREAPACFRGAGTRYCDPFPDDRPLLAITQANAAAHSAQLTPGARALLEKYPDSYRINVYPTRRTFANPAAIYEGALANALHAELSADGLVVSGAVAGTPFPLTKSGAEAVWNHKLRWRGETLSRIVSQYAVSASGEFTQTRSRIDEKFAFAALEGKPPDTLHDLLQVVLQPSRMAGAVVLIRESIADPKLAFQAWEFSPNEKRLRRAPNIGYDNPAAGSDGLRTHDQDDVFSGPLDRYDWKLIGKREYIVPANAYRLHSDALRYRDIIRRGHINPDLPRYELRRVWVVEAMLRKSQTHQYRRRTLYLDEDGWGLRAVENYGADGELWRYQEGHTIEAYDRLFELPVCETVYDLSSGRYLAQALNNEDAEAVAKPFAGDYFDASSAAKLITR